MPKTKPFLPHHFQNGETILITPSLAETILTNLNYSHQRLIRPKHVEMLSTQMKNHEFTPGTQISFGELPDNSLHLVNGQHRLKAVISSETPIMFQILITSCKDETELNTLWRRNDRMVVPRTISDIIHSEGIASHHNLRINVAQAVYQAMLVINSKFRLTSRHADPYLMRSDEARLKMAKDWWEYAINFQTATQTAPSKVKRTIYNAGVTAVGLVTFKYQPEKAHEFWYGLSENDGLRKDDPRNTYVRYLYNTERAKGKSHVETAKAVSCAWNSFFQDKTLSQIRIPDHVLIKGTPFSELQVGEIEFEANKD